MLLYACKELAENSFCYPVLAVVLCPLQSVTIYKRGICVAGGAVGTYPVDDPDVPQGGHFGRQITDTLPPVGGLCRVSQFGRVAAK